MLGFPPPTRILPVVCLVLTIALLCAGLSPFNPFPRNQVTWLSGGGLEFGKRGIVYGAAPMSAAGPRAGRTGERLGTECAVQIRVQPKVVFFDNSGTILDIYTADNPFQFRVMQWHDALLIRRDYLDADHQVKTAEMDLDNAFLGDEPVTFTIIATPESVVALRNGQKAGTSSKMGLSCADFAGQLLLGEAPIQDNPWSGKIFELGLFRKDVSGQFPAELATTSPAANAVESSSASLKPETQVPQSLPPMIRDARAVTHYTFAEGSGKSVHSAIPGGPELRIPYAFVVPHKELLLPPWRELSDKLSLQDIAVNIFGLVPFGFLIFAYFFVQRRWPVGRAAVLTIFLGFALSTTIEVLQAYIPSRTSGVLDIINNTLGTALGVWLFHWRMLQILGSKLGLYDLPSERLAQR